MKLALKIISFLGLAATIVPSILVFKGVTVMKTFLSIPIYKYTITMETHFWIMVIGTIMWFTTSPKWMRSKSLDEEESN